MVTIPSIDVYNNRVVRLKKGQLTDCTYYDLTPVEAVKWLESKGAQRIHIVDLNGAFGEKKQYQLIEKMATTATVPLQMGGGIRTLADMASLYACGIDWTVVSSACFTDSTFLEKALSLYKDQLILALDLVGNQIAIKGWTEVTELTVADFLTQHHVPDHLPLLVTDISKDGLLLGPSMALYRILAASHPNPIMASGGVRDYKDIQDLERLGIAYAIMGKALYEKTLEEKEITACLQNGLYPV